MTFEKVKKKGFFILCVSVGAIMYFLSGEQDKAFDGMVVRNEPGEPTEEYLLNVYYENELYEDIILSVKNRQYTVEECEGIYESNKEKFLAKMLDGNESINNITEDLLFFDECENYPFSFSWQIDKTGLIDEKGKIITAESFDAVITYKADYMSFSKDCSIPIHVEPAEKIILRNKKDYLTVLLNEMLNRNATIKNGEKYVQLPADVDGKQVKYYISGTRRNPILLLGGPLFFLVFMLASKRDERQKKEKQRQLMLKEYPNILQSMSLYLVTGMPVRKIWSRICDLNGKKIGNPIYELMSHSRNELNAGVSEEAVLSSFAEKTQTPEYVRLAALISQNQRKGSTRLSDVLREETMKAYALKRQQALKEGEQAGTKLLIPMMVILVDVMVMIMVPAFWNI